MRRTSPNAKPVGDILLSFMLAALAEGRRFAHVERLRQDPVLAELFGMRSITGADTIRRLLASIELKAGRAWIERGASILWPMLPTRLVLDRDSTVQTKYGHQQDARTGYTRQNPGAKERLPLALVVCADVRAAHRRFPARLPRPAQAAARQNGRRVRNAGA